MEREFTLPQAAKAAIELQNACNSSGIIHDFPNLIKPVWDEARRTSKGTDFVNTHPIVILVLDKLCDLARMDHYSSKSMELYGKAYEECTKLASVAQSG